MLEEVQNSSKTIAPDEEFPFPLSPEPASVRSTITQSQDLLQTGSYANSIVPNSNTDVLVDQVIQDSTFHFQWTTSMASSHESSNSVVSDASPVLSSTVLYSSITRETGQSFVTLESSMNNPAFISPKHIVATSAVIAREASSYGEHLSVSSSLEECSSIFWTDTLSQSDLIEDTLGGSNAQPTTSLDAPVIQQTSKPIETISRDANFLTSGNALQSIFSIWQSTTKVITPSLYISLSTIPLDSDGINLFSSPLVKSRDKSLTAISSPTSNLAHETLDLSLNVASSKLQSGEQLESISIKPSAFAGDTFLTSMVPDLEVVEESTHEIFVRVLPSVPVASLSSWQLESSVAPMDFSSLLDTSFMETPFSTLRQSLSRELEPHDLSVLGNTMAKSTFMDFSSLLDTSFMETPFPTLRQSLTRELEPYNLSVLGNTMAKSTFIDFSSLLDPSFMETPSSTLRQSLSRELEPYDLSVLGNTMAKSTFMDSTFYATDSLVLESPLASTADTYRTLTTLDQSLFETVNAIKDTASTNTESVMYFSETLFPLEESETFSYVFSSHRPVVSLLEPSSTLPSFSEEMPTSLFPMEFSEPSSIFSQGSSAVISTPELFFSSSALESSSLSTVDTMDFAPWQTSTPYLIASPTPFSSSGGGENSSSVFSESSELWEATSSLQLESEFLYTSSFNGAIATLLPLSPVSDADTVVQSLYTSNFDYYTSSDLDTSLQTSLVTTFYLNSWISMSVFDGNTVVTPESPLQTHELSVTPTINLSPTLSELSSLLESFGDMSILSSTTTLPLLSTESIQSTPSLLDTISDMPTLSIETTFILPPSLTVPSNLSIPYTVSEIPSTSYLLPTLSEAPTITMSYTSDKPATLLLPTTWSEQPSLSILETSIYMSILPTASLLTPSVQPPFTLTDISTTLLLSPTLNIETSLNVPDTSIFIETIPSSFVSPPTTSAPSILSMSFTATDISTISIPATPQVSPTMFVPPIVTVSSFSSILTTLSISSAISLYPSTSLPINPSAPHTSSIILSPTHSSAATVAPTASTPNPPANTEVPSTVETVATEATTYTSPSPGPTKSPSTSVHPFTSPGPTKSPSTSVHPFTSPGPTKSPSTSVHPFTSLGPTKSPSTSVHPFKSPGPTKSPSTSVHPFTSPGPTKTPTSVHPFTSPAVFTTSAHLTTTRPPLVCDVSNPEPYLVKAVLARGASIDSVTESIKELLSKHFNHSVELEVYTLDPGFSFMATSGPYVYTSIAVENILSYSSLFMGLSPSILSLETANMGLDQRFQIQTVLQFVPQSVDIRLCTFSEQIQKGLSLAMYEVRKWRQESDNFTVQILNITSASRGAVWKAPVTVSYGVRDRSGFLNGSDVSDQLRNLSLVEFSFFLGFPVKQIAEPSLYPQLDVSPLLKDSWLRTVLLGVVEQQLRGETFQADIERKLAQLISEASSQMRRWKRASFAGSRTVQVVNVSRLDGSEDPVQLVYFVEDQFGKRLPAADVSNLINEVNVQRAAIILGYRVQGIVAQPLNQAQEADRQAQNLWIIVGVAVPVLVVTVIIVILYWKLCRTDKLDFQPDTMSNLQQRQKLQAPSVKGFDFAKQHLGQHSKEDVLVVHEPPPPTLHGPLKDSTPSENGDVPTPKSKGSSKPPKVGRHRGSRVTPSDAGSVASDGSSGKESAEETSPRPSAPPREPKVRSSTIGELPMFSSGTEQHSSASIFEHVDRISRSSEVGRRLPSKIQLIAMQPIAAPPMHGLSVAEREAEVNKINREIQTTLRHKSEIEHHRNKIRLRAKRKGHYEFPLADMGGITDTKERQRMYRKAQMQFDKILDPVSGMPTVFIEQRKSSRSRRSPKQRRRQQGSGSPPDADRDRLITTDSDGTYKRPPGVSNSAYVSDPDLPSDDPTPVADLGKYSSSPHRVPPPAQYVPPQPSIEEVRQTMQSLLDDAFALVAPSSQGVTVPGAGQAATSEQQPADSTSAHGGRGTKPWVYPPQQPSQRFPEYGIPPATAPSHLTRSPGFSSGIMPPAEVVPTESQQTEASYPARGLFPEDVSSVARPRPLGSTAGPAQIHQLTQVGIASRMGVPSTDLPSHRGGQQPALTPSWSSYYLQEETQRNVHSHSHGLQEYGVFPGNRGPARQSAATAHLQPSICYPSGSAEDLHPGHSSASLIKAIREELLRLSQKQAVVTSYHS